MREKAMAGTKIGLVLLAALFLAAAVSPRQVMAQSCAYLSGGPDADGDGIDDSVEAAGSITLTNNMCEVLPSDDYRVSGDCDVTVAVTPGVADHFALVNPRGDTYFTVGTPVLGILDSMDRSSTETASNMGFEIHYLSGGDGNANIFSDCPYAPLAVNIVESTGTLPSSIGRKTAIILGQLTDSVEVATYKIEQWLNHVCTGSTSGDFRTNLDCKDDLGNTGDDLLARFIRMIAAHEDGHWLSLANVSADWISQYNGPHYPSGEDVMMQEFSTYTKKGSKVTFDLTDDFHPESISSRVLP